MTHVTCRLTAKNLDQLRNLTLGNRVWATFYPSSLLSSLLLSPNGDSLTFVGFLPRDAVQVRFRNSLRVNLFVVVLSVTQAADQLNKLYNYCCVCGL